VLNRPSPSVDQYRRWSLCSYHHIYLASLPLVVTSFKPCRPSSFLLIHVSDLDKSVFTSHCQVSHYRSSASSPVVSSGWSLMVVRLSWARVSSVVLFHPSSLTSNRSVWVGHIELECQFPHSGPPTPRQQLMRLGVAMHNPHQSGSSSQAIDSKSIHLFRAFHRARFIRTVSLLSHLLDVGHSSPLLARPHHQSRRAADDECSVIEWQV
jgi:hypothetical protein